MALHSAEFNKFVQDENLNIIRKKFYASVKTTANYDGIGTLMAAKSRSIEYYFDIPMLKLPKKLRKIPRDFRETFPRTYSIETRNAILCRIYGELTSIKEERLKAHWRQNQQYAKILLEYLDYYWKTPDEDRVITGEHMKRLKENLVHFIPAQDNYN